MSVSGCFRCVLRVAGLLLLFTGCSGNLQHTLEYNPREKIRVAVLPFGQVDETGVFIEDDATLAVDGIPLVSSEVSDSPAALTRKLVYAELSRTAIDMVSPLFVDLDLPHRGFAHTDGRFDLSKIFSTPPRVFCRQFLDCDAVLLGKIHKWERSYYGVESAHEIDLELTLVSADSGKVLFHSRASDSESRGLSKGPTGYSSILIEPIRGLNSDIIEALAQRTLASMLRPLRKQVETTADSGPPPAILAASHDAPTGILNTDRALLVVAFASEGMNASFSIGDHVRGVPMFETSKGHYIGEYWLQEGERFAQQPVYVQMTDSLGRLSTLTVDSGLVSTPEFFN